MFKFKALVLSVLLFIITSSTVLAAPTNSNQYVPILMYHNVIGPDDTVTNWSGQVSVSMFRSQLQTLTDNGFTSITFMDYNNYLDGKCSLPEKPFIVTFDDGYLDNYTIAYPIMEEMGVKSTMFVSTKYVGTTTTAGPHFTWDNAMDMENSGLVDIQSHTNTHANMSLVGITNFKEEIETSFNLIEENLGARDIKVLAYPQFKNCWESRKTAVDFGVSLQITTLANEKNSTTTLKNELHRIHVHDHMSGEDLLKEINKLTK